MPDVRIAPELSHDAKTQKQLFVIPEIEVLQLRRFAAVLECGSFVEAARRLNITQQALSASISRMEEATGVRFLERKRGSTIELTASGRLLLARAHTHIAMSDRLMNEIAHLRDATGGSITLAVGETMTGRDVARAIIEFQKTCPDVHIRIIEGYTDSFVDDLLHGEVDFIIGSTSQDLSGSSEVECHYLEKVRDVIVVRADHPLAGGGSASLEVLAGYGWILPGFRGDSLKVVTQAYTAAGLDPPALVIQGDAQALGIWLLLESTYLAMVSPDMVSALVENGLLVVLDTPPFQPMRQAGILTRRVPAPSVLVRALVEHILRSLDTPADMPSKGE